MCYRPLHISNRKPDKNPLVDRFRLTVPCGHCIQCKDEKRMAMWIRSYYEFEECKHNNGFALYITLTYNNKSIPCLSGDLKYKCFNKKDVQKYIKRFRSQLQRKFPSVDCSHTVTYLCASEYGGLTHRPHMHIAFFFHYPFPRWTVRSLLGDCWKLGFTKFGTRNYGFIDSVGALHYVTKYICKDVYEEDYFKKFFEEFCRDYSVPQDQVRKYLKNFLPFYLLSNNFGMYALAIIDDTDLYLGRIKMPDSQQSEKFYKLPLYYDRKFFYDVKYKYYDSSIRDYIYTDCRPADSICFTPVYTLNYKGAEMKVARCENFYKAAENVYLNAIQLNPDFNIQRFNEKFKTNFDSPCQLSSFIAKKISKQDYCNYNLLYSSVNLPLLGSSSSKGHTSFAQDYTLVQKLKSGIRVLDRDIQSFCDNCCAYHDISHIDLVSEMIAFTYFLCQLTFENKRNKEELDYVHNKSLHLQQSENLLY